jgi:hypothetical protein
MNSCNAILHNTGTEKGLIRLNRTSRRIRSIDGLQPNDDETFSFFTVMYFSC